MIPMFLDVGHDFDFIMIYEHIGITYIDLHKHLKRREMLTIDTGIMTLKATFEKG